jgi:FkbM family methyltransferase
MPQVRALQRRIGPAATKRDLRDLEQMRLLLAFTLAHDSNCIDAGANLGNVLTEITRLAPVGRHIAYEPIPALAKDLTQRFPAVDVRCAGLSDGPGEASFFYVRDREGLSGFRRRNDLGAEEVEELTARTEALDSALPEGYVPRLIKIDVEGAEIAVLRGGIETICAHRPIIIFEHGKGGAPPIYGHGPREVHELLVDRAQLRIFDLDGNGPYGPARFEAVFDAGEYWNFVALP